MWASRLAGTSSPHPEPGKSCLDHILAHTQGAAPPAVPTSSHTTGSPQPPRERCHVLMGLLSLAHPQLGLFLAVG